MILVLLLPTRQAWPEAERYRVEVLVLFHLRHDQEPREIRVLNDYSDALDFLQPPAEETDQPPLVEPPGPEDADLVAGAEAPAPYRRRAP